MTNQFVDILVALLVCGAALWLMLKVTIGAIKAEGVSQGRPPSLLFGVGVAQLLVAWLGTAFAAARSPDPGFRVMALVLCFGIPIVVGPFLLLGVPYLRGIVRAVPETALVRVQVVRLLGATLIVEFLLGNLPEGFALPAGIGDVLVGILAIVVGSMIARNPPYAWARWMAVVWNALGLLDLAIALWRGFVEVPLSSPVGIVPLFLVPLFFVPLEVLLHISSLWSLFDLAGARIPDGAAQPAVGVA